MMNFERTTNNNTVSVADGTRSPDFWLRAITITMLVLSFYWLPSMVYGEEGQARPVTTATPEYSLIVDDKGKVTVSYGDAKPEPFENIEELTPYLMEIQKLLQQSEKELSKVVLLVDGSITIVDCGFNLQSVWECKKYVIQ